MAFDRIRKGLLGWGSMAMGMEYAEGDCDG